MDRFYLARDNDGHWFVVPIANREDWRTWLDLDGDDERSWTVPDFAEPVDGSPSLVSFTDPRIE